VAQARSIHLGPAPAKADIVLAIDTTDTMKSVLAQAKAEATQLMAQIKALIPGARFAVMDFRDYDFGGGGTYPYRLHTDGLTGDAATVQAAINGMGTGTGGSPKQPRDPKPPQPEAYNRVLFEAAAEAKLVARGPALGGYDPDAERFMVVLGDEVPRDVSRPARDARFGACPPSAVVDPGRNGVPEAGLGDDLTTEAVIDGLTRSRQTLLMINYKGTYLNCYKQLAQPTGGDGFVGGEAVQVGARIVDAITLAAGLINRVDLVPQAGCPPIRFEPAGPYGPIQTLTTPNLAVAASMTVPRDGQVHTCNVVVVADGARRSVETFQVLAPAGARAAPATVTLSAQRTEASPA
jgi:hypothetical protein